MTWRGTLAARKNIKDRIDRYAKIPVVQGPRKDRSFFALVCNIFPATWERVVSIERDLILTKRLRDLSKADVSTGPKKIVGVFGNAHVVPIMKNWSTIDAVDISDLCQVPPPTPLFHTMRAIYRLCQFCVIVGGVGVFVAGPIYMFKAFIK